MPPHDTLEQLLEFACAAARAAGDVTLKYFQKNPGVETKPDGSAVTAADREAEQLLRQRIEQRFPSHGILGEEYGAVRQDAEWRWLLDPVDGTASFVRGVPLYGVMVAVEHNGEPVVGVVYFPALRETVWARRGGGTWCNGSRARVSAVSELAQATLLYTDPRGFAAAGREAAWQKLRAATKLERTWGDCYGHILVATGRAEVMLDPLLDAWDAAALLPILEEAGGRFTDWRGQRTTRGGSGVSTNAALHDAAMRLL